jgi:hypothetical protein
MLSLKEHEILPLKTTNSRVDFDIAIAYLNGCSCLDGFTFDFTPKPNCQPTQKFRKANRHRITN